ncbi:MAG: hypothetical protein ACOY3Y_06350 [Acidobacteriota bacterium]
MSRTPVPIVVAVSVFAAAALAGEPPATRVSGTLTVDGTATPLVLGYVDESPEDIILLLAAKEVPRDVVPFVGEDVARRLKIHAVAFTVSRAEKALAQGFAGLFHPGPEMGWAALNDERIRLELTRCDATGIEGRIFSPAPFESFDQTFAFDASFAFPLGAAAPPPPPIEVKISGDTSAPSQAYAAYYRAVLGGDTGVLRSFLPASRQKEFDGMPADERAMIMELFAMRPAEISIAKTAVSGDTATLTVEGLNETAGKSIGTVTMRLENGVWKVDSDTWKTTSE